MNGRHRRRPSGRPPLQHTLLTLVPLRTPTLSDFLTLRLGPTPGVLKPLGCAAAMRELLRPGSTGASISSPRLDKQGANRLQSCRDEIDSCAHLSHRFRTESAGRACSDVIAFDVAGWHTVLSLWSAGDGHVPVVDQSRRIHRMVCSGMPRVFHPAFPLQIAQLSRQTTMNLPFKGSSRRQFWLLAPSLTKAAARHGVSSA